MELSNQDMRNHGTTNDIHSQGMLHLQIWDKCNPRQKCTPSTVMGEGGGIAFNDIHSY